MGLALPCASTPAADSGGTSCVNEISPKISPPVSGHYRRMPTKTRQPTQNKALTRPRSTFIVRQPDRYGRRVYSAIDADNATGPYTELTTRPAPPTVADDAGSFKEVNHVSCERWCAGLHASGYQAARR